MSELSVLGGAFSWAISLVLLRPLTLRHAPFQIAAVRIMAPAIIFVLVVTASGRWNEVADMSLSTVAAILGAAVLGVGAGEVLVISAVPRIGPSRAYALASSYPLFAALLAITLFGETLTVSAGVGALMTVAGAAMLSIELTPKPGFDFYSQWGFRASMGAALALLAAMLFALDLNLLTFALAEVSPEILNAVRMPVAMLGLHTAALVTGKRFALVSLGRRDSVIALGSGFIALVLGGYLFLVGIQQVGAARGGALSATAPVFVLILSMIFLRERPGYPAIAGLLSSVVGVGLITIG